jgi:iron complex outermembrane receptor protein
VKYEQKDLSKFYMICGYWTGYGVCPAQDGLTDAEKGIYDPSLINSNNPTPLPPSLGGDTPNSNILKTIDRGVFTQAIYEVGKWRLNAGIRWDENSVYGSVVNPRGAAIYHWSNVTA